jgi:tether containing UBX domain for GLUT4
VANPPLRRGGTKLDLSLPVRLARLSPGARLDLARAESSSAPATITLRIVGGTDQIVGTFAPATTIWGVLRKVEADARTAGQNDVNITERCAPSPDTDSGRLLYQMPAVRVANRELVKFDELKKTLEEIGLNGRELLTIRFLPTEIPYEDALMEIAGMSNDGTLETVSGQAPAMELAAGKPTVEKAEEDMIMPDTPAETSTAAAEPSSIQTTVVAESSTSTFQVPTVIVFRPSSSAVPTAAMLDVPDSAYDIGISELKKIKDSYHAAAQPQRLLSDKELTEKDATMRQEMEKIHTLKIRIRFPDSYISQQELDGSATGALRLRFL